MKKPRKIRVGLVAVAVLLAFCSAARGQHEVRLVYANAQWVPSQYGGDRTSFKVHVKNHGAMDNAKVYIDYDSQLYGGQHSFQLTPERFHAHHSSFIGLMFDLPKTFVVRYVTVAGTFYDKNGNKGYYDTDANKFHGAVGYGVGMLSCKRTYFFAPLHFDPVKYPAWAYLSLEGEVCLDDPSRAAGTLTPAPYTNGVVAHVRVPGGAWIEWPCQYDKNMAGYFGGNDIEVWKFEIPWWLDINQSWYFTMPFQLKFTRKTYDKKTGQLLNTFGDKNFGFTYDLEFPFWLWGTPQVWGAFDNTVF
ncbi:MAG: hypothetical protein KKC51_12215 [Verrucomicrobia bacterium]|nr:hypothetical protein [Verrucomicrobiota bacterium]